MYIKLNCLNKSTECVIHSKMKMKMNNHNGNQLHEFYSIMIFTAIQESNFILENSLRKYIKNSSSLCSLSLFVVSLATLKAKCIH